MIVCELQEERKEKAAIVSSEKSNAIQIMTLHKSKGLEFPIVILPEFTFFERLQKKYFWTDNTIKDVLPESS